MAKGQGLMACIANREISIVRDLPRILLESARLIGGFLTVVGAHMANLELGYLTPPMGENLFLSASRFGVPVTRVFRCTWPFYLALGLGVAAVTYLPGLTLAAIRLFGS